jgi:CRISPR-associated endonuclease/helicase Cas3/CRISPR-associated endonuclease Cas3-HD
MTFETIFSHPPEDGRGTRLDAHLQETADRIVDLGRFENGNHSVSMPIAYATGRLHDFGKVTPAFQAYLRESYSGPAHLRYHARISAFAGFWAARQLEATDREALAVFTAVARHHGRLPDLLDYLLEHIIEDETSDGDIHNYATQQVDAIAADTSPMADTLLQAATDGAVTWDGFQTAMKTGQITESLTTLVAEKEAFGYLNQTPEELPPQLYDATLGLWSALTLADKTAAAGIERADLSPTSLDQDSLETYIDGLPAGSGRTATLNDARERARLEAIARTRANLGPNGADVGVLTLPTGLGKTFTGTSVALTLQEQLERHRDHPDPPPIVYALPFTAIIEQTRSLFEDPNILDADPRSHEFTVHHYLSDTVTFPSSEADMSGRDADVPEAGLLGESWRSGLVLTTFVQLFESLAGPTNSQSLKLLLY